MPRSIALALTLLLALAASARPAPAAAKSDYYQVLLNFYSEDATGCVGTWVSAFATAGNDPTLAVDEINVYDYCTQTKLVDEIWASTTNYAGGQDLLFRFKIHPHLRSATVSGTVRIHGCSGTVCPLPVSELTVDLTIEGVGDLRESSWCECTSRDAVATGTITDGTTNYTSTPSRFGELSRSRYK